MQETPPTTPDISPSDGESGSAIAEVFRTDDWQRTIGEVWAWVQSDILNMGVAIQAAFCIGAFVPAFVFGPRIRRFILRNVRDRMPAGALRRVCDAFATLATLIALWLVLSIGGTIIGGMGRDNALIDAVQSLLTAAIFIRLVTLVIQSPFWSKVAFFVAWPIAALDAFGLLDWVVDQLKAASIPISENAEGIAITISALDIVRAAIIFGIFFWIASVATGLIGRRIETVDELNPSFKALLLKVLNFIMPIIALVLALNMIGFNLASLAVFSGAVGLGIGLGLQKIIANFLAGFTLLADKSIKPGDVIEIDGTFGWVTDMKSRYVAIKTRDGHENLVPNATFIDEGVINWSHSDRAIRIHAPFGVSYKTRNLRQITLLAQDCAAAVDRVLAHPSPQCNLMELGDSSVNFDLRFWVSDPANGISNVRSEVLLNIWDALHENGIEIPFPQLDVHVRSPGPSAPEGLADTSKPA